MLLSTDLCRYYLSRDIASSDLTARLQLLTIHFPSLRILWSPSPHATAELFEELKKGREQPDPSKAASLNMDVVDEAEASRGDRYNAVAKDFLSKLPGVTSRNVYAIMNRAEDLKDLLEFGVDDLEEVMGSRENALLLHRALHEKTSEKADGSGSAEGKGRRQAQPGKRFKTKNNTK